MSYLKPRPYFQQVRVGLSDLFDERFIQYEAKDMHWLRFFGLLRTSGVSLATSKGYSKLLAEREEGKLYG